MPLTPEQQDEIAAQRAETRPTRRATVPALEEILYEALPVLDHGFVRVIDYMGDDGAIVQAARVSYGRGTRRVSEDRSLINYLMRHRHTTRCHNIWDRTFGGCISAAVNSFDSSQESLYLDVSGNRL